MAVDIGHVGIWCGFFDPHPAAKVQEACREIEAMGYKTLWIPETVGRDPFVAASLWLQATSTLRLATGIANIYARDPITMVACQRALAEAYPGRFLLGMGVSHEHLVAKLRKHDYSKPYSHMRSYLEAMDSAIYMSVNPDEDPGRVIAALGPKMLELAAGRASGAHPYLTTPEHTARAREIMGPDALLAPEQMVVLEEDAERARTIARATLSVYLRAPNYLRNLRTLGFDDSDWADHTNASERLVDAIVAWGDASRIAERVNAHIEAGANHVCVQVLRPNLDLPLDEWRELAGVLL